MKGFSKILLITLIGLIERFSFYAILSILVLFMVSDDIGFSFEKSSRLYNFFLYLIYFTPILFGLIADLTNRKIVIGLGILTMVIGYLLIFWLSGSTSGFYFSFIITAVGLSLFRPNILVLVGDTAMQFENKKLVLLGYVLFGLLGSIVGFISGFLSAYIRLYFGYQILFLSVSLILVPAIIIYYFKFYRQKETTSQNSRKPYQGIILAIAFGTSFLIALGLRGVNITINKLLDFDAVAHYFEDKYSFDAIIELLIEIIFVIISFIALGLLFTKLVSVDFKSLVPILIIGLIMVIIFLVYSNFYLIDNTNKSNKLFVIITLIMSLLEILVLPIIRYFIYMYSFKFKGLAFGIYFAQFAVISKFLLRNEIGNNTLIYISIAIFMIAIAWIAINRKTTTLPNSV